MKYLYILFGGGIGAVLRYILSTWIYTNSGKIFPLGTLIVNLVGCFIIGVLSCLFEKIVISPDLRLFIFVGLLGGFTTFSSFGLETYNLLRNSEFKLAIENFLFSNFLGIGFVFVGFILARVILKFIK